jgi:hypothetical protein
MRPVPTQNSASPHQKGGGITLKIAAISCFPNVPQEVYADTLSKKVQWVRAHRSPGLGAAQAASVCDVVSFCVSWRINSR